MICTEEKIILLPDHDALLIADVHLGKITHFRRSGIGIPNLARKGDYQQLNNLLEQYPVNNIYLMGDLFHSDLNSDWVNFEEFMHVYKDKNFTLIKGNHDVLSKYTYDKSRLHLEDQITIRQLILTHEPLKEIPEGFYNLCGHIHPAVRLRGQSRQSMRLPCFYFGKQCGIMPAFGRFTGSATVQPRQGDQIVVITKKGLLMVD